MLPKNDFIRQSLLEFVKYIKGHENSKHESAPWVVISHKTGKVLASFATKAEAKKHLQMMHVFSS